MTIILSLLAIATSIASIVLNIKTERFMRDIERMRADRNTGEKL